MVTKFNAKKKLKMHAIYEEILKEVYISAFNMCIMSYHSELEEFFKD